MRVVFIGFMGAGKSKVAQEFAIRFGTVLFDSDQSVEVESGGAPAHEIFSSQGETAFRDLERKVIEHRHSMLFPLGIDVWALGGGSITIPEVADLLEDCLVIHLDVDVESAWTRVSADTTQIRPLATDRTAFEELYASRRSLYEKLANHTIDATASAVDIANSVARIVEAAHPGFEYERDIIVGSGIIELFESSVAILGAPSFAVVYDNAVEEFAESIIAMIRRTGRDVDSIVGVPMGEWNKQLSTAENMLSQWHNDGVRSDTRVIAVGGGALLDTAGFAASVYHRGLDWISVPTTVTAQVDAGIGGKTGVNLGVQKNIVGSFAMPRLVVADTNVLHSLSSQLVRDGLIEAIKTGLLCGEDVFASVEAAVNTSPSDRAWIAMTAACAAYKVGIVERDPKDRRGIRAVLNLGHTTAHAIEAATSGTVSHGAAVACGIRFALLVSIRELELDPAILERYEDCCKQAGILTRTATAWEQLAPHLNADKKRKQSGIGWVLLAEIGEPRSGMSLDLESLGDVWNESVYSGSPAIEIDSEVKRILVLFGVNLGQLGIRDQKQYGSQTLSQLAEQIDRWAADAGFIAEVRQTDSLERFIHLLHASAAGEWNAIVVNPGAWTHYERSLHDAIEPIQVPVVEIHLSDVKNREEWRHESVISEVVDHTISGKGGEGYREAFAWLGSQI